MSANDDNKKAKRFRLGNEGKILLLISLLLCVIWSGIPEYLKSLDFSSFDKVVNSIGILGDSLCCLGPITFLLSIIVVWIVWNGALFFIPAQGVKIGRKLGKIEFFKDEGWRLHRYKLPNRKASLNIADSSPHILIVGGSQTGKSVTMKVIFRNLKQKPELKSYIFDFHGEYEEFFKKNELVYTLIDGSQYNPIKSNFSSEKKEDILSDFIESLIVAFDDISDQELALLKKKLKDDDLHKIYKNLLHEEENSKGEDKKILTTLCLKLEKIVRSDNENVLPLEELIKENNIIFDFSKIRDQKAANFIAENILRRLFHHCLINKKQTNIYVDEAHRLNTTKLNQKGYNTTIVRIAKEAAKFGVRLIIASQNLTDFPDGFTANFGNIISFRLPSPKDIEILETTTGIKTGLINTILNGLKKREALLIAPKSEYQLIKVDLPSEPNKIVKWILERFGKK